MAQTLEELMAALQAQRNQEQSNVPLIANLLGAGLNVAGAISGKGAIGSPLTQVAGQIANRQAQRQNQAQSSLVDLFKLGRSEERAKSREGRAAKQDLRLEARAKRDAAKAQELDNFTQTLNAPDSPISKLVDEETFEFIKLLPPKEAMATLKDLQSSRVKQGRRDAAATKRLQNRAKSQEQFAAFKQTLNTIKPDIVDKIQQELAAQPEGQTNVLEAAMRAGLPLKQATEFADNADALEAVGIDKRGIFGFREDDATRARQAGQQVPAQQAEQQQQLLLQQEALRKLQEVGAPATPQNIQQMMNNLQR